MAQQERPVGRTVALKIIKLGMDTRNVIARFEQERQALAMMDHPNIAKVFEAGATVTRGSNILLRAVAGFQNELRLFEFRFRRADAPNSKANSSKLSSQPFIIHECKSKTSAAQCY